MAWAGGLYYVSYLSVPNAGTGGYLYRVEANMSMTVLHHHNSCYANRMIHPKTNQIVIGPYVIDTEGNIKIFKDLLSDRLGGMALHINKPDEMVYLLSMDGPLYEANVVTMEVTKLYDLADVLGINKMSGEQPHFKAAHTSVAGLLYVASNTFEQSDFQDSANNGNPYSGGGRLASWDGNPAHNWTILERTAFVEVTGRRNFGEVVYAVGWDAASSM